jgi:hypothetical protein
MRGLGLARATCERDAVLRLAVDLAAEAERLPPAGDLVAAIAGLRLPRLPLVAGAPGLYEVRLVLDMLRMRHPVEDSLASNVEAG